MEGLSGQLSTRSLHIAGNSAFGPVRQVADVPDRQPGPAVQAGVVRCPPVRACAVSYGLECLERIDAGREVVDDQHRPVQPGLAQWPAGKSGTWAPTRA